MLIVSARLRFAGNARKALNVWYAHGYRYVHNQPARLRFAPSPTGQLHLGGLRTALFNYLLAKKTGGQFILRIEDTDQTRYVEGATEKLIAALSWAGIRYDEGPNVGGPHEPYFQSQRTKIYQQHAEQLIEDGHAYRCFCSPERLDQVRDAARKAGRKIAYDKHCAHLSNQEIKDHLAAGTPYTVRLRTPEGITSVDDNIHGKVTFSNSTLDDGILLKSDGYPTYHLANVVDDHMMGITHVLRGDEWLPSTPKHLILYKAFGWKPPQFYHLPLLLNPGGGKMSKRKGDAFVEHYIEQGYFPEAVNNFVALLGWSPQDPENEVLTSDELLAEFDVKGLNKSQAIVDMGKLGWLNKQHLLRRAETLEGRKEMARSLKPLLDSKFGESVRQADKVDRLTVDYIEQVIDCVRERIRNIHDVPDFCQYFFVEPDYTSQEAIDMKKKLKKQATDLVFSKETIEYLQNVSTFDVQTLNEYFNNLAKQSGASYNKILTAIRYGVTGKSIGASIAHTMVVLGRGTCIERFQNAPL